MVAMATKQNFERCHTWSQLKAHQSLLLNSTLGATSWNYIFSQQDGFGVLNGFVGGCLGEKKSQKVCFHKCKSILSIIQSIECRFFFHMLLGFKMIPVAKNLTIWKYPFVSVNMNMSARNRHFHASYWCITKCISEGFCRRASPLGIGILCPHGRIQRGRCFFRPKSAKRGCFSNLGMSMVYALAGRE